MININSENKYAHSSRPEMAVFLPDNYSKILEIGCNIGNFRQFLTKPCEYWGIEPLKEAAEIAKQKMDKIIIGFYDQVEKDIPDNYFDLILVFDVIEHMENTVEFLKSIKTKMTNNASIIFSIPNVRYYDNLKELLYKKDWEYKDIGILDITHLRFFTEKSVIRILTDNDFVIKEIKGVGSYHISKKRKNRINYLKERIIFKLHKLIFGSDIEFNEIAVIAKKQ